MHGTAEERALIDSGASENFMDHRMIQRLGIGTRTLPEPRRVFNVDGTENKGGTLTDYCTLRVRRGEHESLQKFYITHLGSERAIFGYPWLKEFRPSIDWDQGKLRGPKTRIETVMQKWARPRALQQLITGARKSEEWEEGDEVIALVAMSPSQQEPDQKLPKEYQKHHLLFSEEGARHFPPSRPEDHAIRIKPGAPQTINCKVYPLTRAELDAKKQFIKDNKELGRIKDSDSPWSTLFFYIKKKDGTRRPIQDYREVNKWTERDVYPMPQIEQILEELHGKVLFTTLDIWDGYNNIRVRPKD